MGVEDQNLSGAVLSRLRDAEAGKTEALYNLGLLYSTGNQVELNYVEAHKWFNLAALRGLKRAVIDREELAHDMSALEIAEAQRQARQWLAAH
ncbi:MAG: hypothetical protein ACOY99_08920 [Pseudomonadota bacterium]